MSYRDPRAAEARRLRAEEGLSSKEIRERLGVGKNKLQYWLAGLPTSRGLRPNARDDLKAAARELRADGLTYPEISERLGVSKSSVSLWVRDIPVGEPETVRGWTSEARARRAANLAVKRERQAVGRRENQRELREQFGPYNDRDALIAGAVAYWCEGAKEKPWSRGAQTQFVNSDPGLIRLFLRFLELVPVEHGGPVFRIYIHESAGDEEARRFWARELDVPVDGFARTVWKRHNPKTVRKNVSGGYHGCLAVHVRRSTALCRYIEDLAAAVLAEMGTS